MASVCKRLFLNQQSPPTLSDLTPSMSPPESTQQSHLASFLIDVVNAAKAIA
jgi:hypothetical protein